ncbi:MAG: ABC transporter ATP-binding protein [Polyangiaceae bacterium]
MSAGTGGTTEVTKPKGPVQPQAKKSRGAEKVAAFHEEAAMGKAYDTRLLARLWPYVKPHSKFVVISIAMLFVLIATSLVRPLVMGEIAKDANARNAPAVFHDGVVMAALMILVQVLTFAQTYAMQLAGARAMSDLRAAIFRHLQRISLRFLDKTPVGRLVTRATNDVDALGELFASAVFNAVGDLVSLVGIVVMMVVLDWRMSLISFASLPLVGLLVNFIRKRSREAFRDIRSKTARLNVFLNEQVNGIAVVQAFSRERAMATEFDEINLAYRDANKRSIYYEAVLDAAIEMVSTVCIASVLWWAGVAHAMAKVGDGAVTFALVVTFTQYIKQSFEPISMLSQRYTLLQSAMSGAERIFEFLDTAELEPETDAKALESADTAAEEAVALDHVDFEYKPGVPVLSDVSLTAKRGEKIALVGATGAGKSTVLSLLLRLYEPNAGDVRVFGKNVREYDRNVLRSLFAVVPQSVFLFAGTVASNVAMGDDAPDLARVETALRRIDAYDLFMRREGGLGARVDEMGANFSAGERQLLAFARALYSNAPILVLDEATASVDSDTEARLQVALDAVMEGRTSVVVAHRLSTIKAANRIVVFHKGRVAEWGTHDELVAKNGVYARLHRLQFAQDEAAHLGQTPPPGSPESLASPVRSG